MKTVPKTTMAIWMAAGLFALHAAGSEQTTAGTAIPAQPQFSKNDPAAYGRELAEYMDQYDQGWKDEIVQGQMTPSPSALMPTVVPCGARSCE